MPTSLLERLAPAVSGEFRIERQLGAGATATVYLARDLKHDRLVALKALRPEIALAVGADRFLREIRTAARLHHPCILPVHDSGEADGLLYFTMPFVEGETLRQRLERTGPLPVAEALRIVRDVGTALAHAHGQGVVHRDVKPENILLQGDHALVADFGLALALEEPGASRLTQSGVAVGTPQYMSPEQAWGKGTVGPRSDLYSLACVLYEMLAGEPPFYGSSVHAVLSQHAADIPAPLHRRRSGLPASVEASVEQALAKLPDDRFASVEEFLQALEDPRRRRRRRLVPRWWRTGLGVAGVAGLAALAGVAVAGRTPAPLRERDWVLVSDFDGPAGDPTLATAVRELVTTELNQSRYLTTMPRSQLAGTLRAAGLAESTRVNPDLARELAFRSAIRVVVGGTVARRGTGYSIQVRAVGVENGDPLASITVTASGDSLVPAVERAGRDLRRSLGERRGDLAANQVLLDIATPSLPAYRRYIEALAQKQQGNVAGSTHLLREAISLDTGFAAAYALIGLNHVEARNLDSARAAFVEALKRPARLSTSQAYRLRGDAAYALDHDIRQAIRWYDRYLAETPRSIGGRTNRGFYLSLLGEYQAALNDFEGAAANSPFGPREAQPAIMNATDMLLALGELDRAKAKARDLTGAYAHYASLRFRLFEDDWRGADSVAAELLAGSATPPALRLEATTARAAALAATGSPGAADTLLRREAREAQPPARYWYESARSILAFATPSVGIDPGTLVKSDTAPGAVTERGLRMALLGDTAEALVALKRLDALSLAVRGRLGQGPSTIEAILAGRRGDWPRLVTLLSDSARVGEHDPTALDRVPAILTRSLVALAHQRLGDAKSAAEFRSLALSTAGIPASHLALRGLAFSFDLNRTPGSDWPKAASQPTR